MDILFQETSVVSNTSTSDGILAITELFIYNMDTRPTHNQIRDELTDLFWGMSEFE